MGCPTDRSIVESWFLNLLVIIVVKLGLKPVKLWNSVFSYIYSWVGV